MSNGIVKWFNDRKGFGFIEQDDGTDHKCSQTTDAQGTETGNKGFGDHEDNTQNQQGRDDSLDSRHHSEKMESASLLSDREGCEAWVSDARVNCAGPNCHRTFGRIKTVWIWARFGALDRIVEKFGEAEADKPIGSRLVISAVPRRHPDCWKTNAER